MGDASPDLWDAVAVLNRWVLYTSMLMASGSALCLLLLKPPSIAADATARLGRLAAIVSAPAYVLAIGFGGAAMLGSGLGAILTTQAWSLGFDTSVGSSAILGFPGMLLLIYALTVRRSAAIPLAVGLAIASFLVTGHAATAAPVWLTAPIVGIHLLCAAFWFGAFAPLYVAVRKLPAVEAAVLITRFSAQAVYAVGAIVVSGCIIAAVQVEGVSALATTDYGLRLLAKLALVAAIIGLAAYNKWVLTPKLRRGERASAASIRRLIVVEILLYLLILGAAVSLTMTAPPRAL